MRYGSTTMQTAIAVVCWSGICGLGSIEIGSLGPINTLPFDHKSGSPESLVSLLPDINKPPLAAKTTKNAGRRSWGGHRPAWCICDGSFPTGGVAKHCCCLRDPLRGELLRIPIPRTPVNKARGAGPELLEDQVLPPPRCVPFLE